MLTAENLETSGVVDRLLASITTTTKCVHFERQNQAAMFAPWSSQLCFDVIQSHKTFKRDETGNAGNDETA